MPNMDGTGPNGQGPMTGRGVGHCADSDQKSGRGYYRGIKKGKGTALGRGWVNQTRPYLPSQDEYIKDRKEELNSRQNEIDEQEKKS